MHIVTAFYLSTTGSYEDNDRTEELMYCVNHNMNSPFVEKIHLFIENEAAHERIKTLSHCEHYNKIHIVEGYIVPTYIDIFTYIITNLKNEVCMVTNSDIYLYECQGHLLEKLKNERTAYALSRYEADIHYAPAVDQYHGSHDAYIFKVELEDSILKELNYYQNHPGIESRIINALCNQGFTMYNPSYQIKIVHQHRIQIRNHREWIGIHDQSENERWQNSKWNLPPCTL